MPPPTTTTSASGGGLRTAGFVVGGVGLASVIVGSVFGGMTIAANDTANSNCLFNNGTLCNPQGVSAGRDASTFATVSTATFIAGGVCLAAGVVLVIVGKPSKRAAAHIEVVPSLGGLLVNGAF
jgi:hypothetical protein